MSTDLFLPMTFEDCLLAKNQIDIWQFSLLNLPSGALRLLNNDEQQRAFRFHFSRHQRRFIVARAMLRSILARYLDVEPLHLTLSYQKHGKPFIHHPLKIEFNLSHSKDLALLAVGKEFPLGIDIEYYSKRPYENIGLKLFSPEENKTLSIQPEHLKPSAFFTIWAQKEAFIKAGGLGLAYPTTTFTVGLRAHPDECIYDQEHQLYWKIVSFNPDIASAGALCYDPSVSRLRYIKIDPTQVIGRSITA